MNSGTISVIISVAFLVALAIGFFRGFFKGALKSIIDAFLGGLALALSFPITKIIMGMLVNSRVLSFVANIIMDALPSGDSSYVEAIKGYMSSEETGALVTESLELISALPTIFVAPLIFIVVFVVLAFVLFGMGFFIKIFVNIEKQRVGGRIFGAVLSALTYVIVITAFIIPINGYINMVNDTAVHILEVVEESELPNNGGENEETNDNAPIENGGIIITSSKEIIEEDGIDKTPVEGEAENNSNNNKSKLDISAIKPILEEIIEYTNCSKDSPVLSIISSFGGKKIFNSLTTAKTSSADICLEKELNGLIDLYGVALKFANTNPKEYGDVQAEATREANDIISSSDYLPELVSRIVSFVTGELYAGRDVFGLEKPNLGEDFNPALDRALRVLKDTDADDIRKDLITISSIASEAIESGVISEATADEVDVLKFIENKELIEVIFVELYKNSRTRNLIPYVTSYITDYIYTLYDDINDTSTEIPGFDYTQYNEERMYEEATYVINTIEEVRAFISTIDASGEELDPRQIIISGDFAALGRGLENMRDSIFTDRIFKIVIYAVLHSELAEQLAIVDEQLIENANNENTDLEAMLVSRQNIMKLAISIQDMENREQTNLLIDNVIESLINEDTSALTAIVSKDNLEIMGMNSKQAESIESIVGSMVNGAAGFDFESDEEKQEEIKKTEEIIFAIGNTVLDEEREHHHMFDQGDGIGSTTEMTAQNFVDQIVDSKLTSSMVQSAVKDKNGDAIDNPYNLQGEISQDDITQIENALNNSYTKDDVTEDQKKTIEALASIFGITLN